MGDMLYLAKSDYTDVASKVDLLGGGLQLVRGSWSPRAGHPSTGSGRAAAVVDTFDLVGVGDNGAIIAEINRIEELLEYARTYPLNPVQADGVWLEWGIDAEPRGAAEAGYPAKRAWVYGGELEVNGQKGMPGPLMDAKITVRLAIERHPAWENLEPVSDSVADSAWGDVIDLTGLTEIGPVPGRIGQLVLDPDSTAEQEFWFGIREVNAGWSEFDPLWECEDGTNGTDTSDAADGTASGGDHCVCTFATEAGLEERVSLRMDEAHSGVTDGDHFHGRYVVLLRAKVGSSTECGIVLRYGGYENTLRAKLEEVYIDNTSWMLIELGEVTLPAGGWREEQSLGSDGPIDYCGFSLDAERLSGSGSLYLDCLYLIPADHFVHGAFSSVDLGNTQLLAVTFPNDEHLFKLINDTTMSERGADVAARNWFIPANVAFAVLAMQEVDAHSLTAVCDIDMDWYPRWTLYRGT